MAASEAATSLRSTYGRNPAGKVATIVAGMLAGADGIDDLNIARHGGAIAQHASPVKPVWIFR